MSQVKQFPYISWVVSVVILRQMVPHPSVGREEATMVGIPCIYKVEFTYKCTKDAIGECL